MRDLTQQILNKLISTSTGDINGKIIDLYDKMNSVYNDLASTSTSYTKGKIADLYTKMNNIYNELNSTSTSYMKGKINAIYTKVHSVDSGGIGMKFTYREKTLIKTLQTLSSGTGTTSINKLRCVYFDTPTEGNYCLKINNFIYSHSRTHHPALHIANLINNNHVTINSNDYFIHIGAYNGTIQANTLAHRIYVDDRNSANIIDNAGKSIDNIYEGIKIYVYLFPRQRILLSASCLTWDSTGLDGPHYDIPQQLGTTIKIYSTY